MYLQAKVFRANAFQANVFRAYIFRANVIEQSSMYVAPGTFLSPADDRIADLVSIRQNFSLHNSQVSTDSCLLEINICKFNKLYALIFNQQKYLLNQPKDSLILKTFYQFYK
jgi:hypothetical protein